MITLLLVGLLLAPEGRPLFYWGSRTPIVVADYGPGESTEPRVVEVHAARDGADLVLRFSFDRPVAGALRLADGTPVSGRLRATLYIDADDDRTSGLSGGPKDLTAGAERRVDVGTLFLGEDPEENRKADVLVSVTLWGLQTEGRRRQLWRGDDSSEPGRVSWRGEWVEVRLPEARVGLDARSRFVIADGDRAWDGRFEDGRR
jgi:hypothetical protein